jgi:hypothetical protein
MKKVAIAVIVGLGLLATTASADAAKGQKLYQKKLKKVCGFSGGKFAAKHTQDEWTEARDNGSLGKMMTEACPAGKKFFDSKKFKKRYSSHLYDFVNDFASDSGNIPSC